MIFVLWDDHIYDAWVKKARELNFSSVEEPWSAVPKNSAASTEKETPRAKEPADGEDHGLSSENSFRTTKIIELDTPDATETDKNLVVKKEMVARLPSVPGDSSDTQRTVEMEEDDKAGNAALDSQKTYVASTAEQLERRKEFPFDTFISRGLIFLQILLSHLRDYLTIVLPHSHSPRAGELIPFIQLL